MRTLFQKCKLDRFSYLYDLAASSSHSLVKFEGNFTSLTTLPSIVILTITPSISSIREPRNVVAGVLHVPPTHCDLGNRFIVVIGTVSVEISISFRGERASKRAVPYFI